VAPSFFDCLVMAFADHYQTAYIFGLDEVFLICSHSQKLAVDGVSNRGLRRQAGAQQLRLSFTELPLK
jgi:hypothetical protein